MSRGKKWGYFGWRGALMPAVLLCSATLTSSVFGQAIDFSQPRNKQPNPGEIKWINGIVNAQHSVFFEGMSLPQRVILANVEESGDGCHKLEFNILATKGQGGAHHAFDFITSWAQAFDEADGLANPYTVAPVGGPSLMGTLFTRQCGDQIGNNPDFEQICMDLHTACSDPATDPDCQDVAAPAPSPVLGDNVASRATAYEGFFGSRTVRIYSTKDIEAGATLTFVGYTGSGDDQTAFYELDWCDVSVAGESNFLMEYAGHTAVGENSGFPGVGYGAGLGAGNINGGPYHHALEFLDGDTTGSRDNQLMASAILIPPPVCERVDCGTDDLSPCLGDLGPTCCVIASGGTGTLTYNWTTPTGPVTTTDACFSVGIVDANDDGSYTVIVEDESGELSSETCGFSLIVNDPPTCNPSDLCLPGQLQANCSGGSGTGYICTWNGPGVVPTNGACTFTPTEEGAFSVTCKDSEGCVSASCPARTEDPVFAEAGDGGKKCEEPTGDTSFGPLSEAGCTNGDALWEVTAQPSSGCVSISDINADHPTITFKEGCTGDATLKLTCSSDETDPLCLPDDDTAEFTVWDNPTCDLSAPAIAVVEAGIIRGGNVSGGTQPYTCDDADFDVVNYVATGCKMICSNSTTACSIDNDCGPGTCNRFEVGFTINDPVNAPAQAVLTVSVLDDNDCPTDCPGDIAVPVDCQAAANPVCEDEEGHVVALITDGILGQLQTIDWYGPIGATTPGPDSVLLCDPEPICPPFADLIAGAYGPVIASEGGLAVGDSTVTTLFRTESDEGCYAFCSVDKEPNGRVSTCGADLPVFPNPTCNITGETLICDVDDSTKFCAAPSGGTAPYRVEWSDGTVCTGIDPNHADPSMRVCCIIATTAGTYSVDVQDSAPVTRADAPDHCFGECDVELFDENCRCRVTGGGNDGRIPPKSWADGEFGDNQWTMGGQAGAPSASGHPAFGEWTHHQKNGPFGRFIFHGGTNSAPSDTTFVQNISCTDPQNCHPARPAPHKQISFDGVGTIKNGKLVAPSGATFRKNDLLCFFVEIEDLGEPGNKALNDETDDETNPECPFDGHPSDGTDEDRCDKCVCADWYSISIVNCNGLDGGSTDEVVYHVRGYIHGGNFQIHPLVGETYDGLTCGDFE